MISLLAALGAAFAFLARQSPSASCAQTRLLAWEQEVLFVPIITDAVVEGWSIQNIKADGEWAQVGFQKNDLLMELGEFHPKSTREFRALLAGLCQPGKTLRILRGGKPLDLQTDIFNQK